MKKKGSHMVEGSRSRSGRVNNGKRKVAEGRKNGEFKGRFPKTGRKKERRRN